MVVWQKRRQYTCSATNKSSEAYRVHRSNGDLASFLDRCDGDSDWSWGWGWMSFLGDGNSDGRNLDGDMLDDGGDFSWGRHVWRRHMVAALLPIIPSRGAIVGTFVTAPSGWGRALAGPFTLTFTTEMAISHCLSRGSADLIQ